MDNGKMKALLSPANTTIKQAMQKLNDTAEKILFIVDQNERLQGTVTDGDIRRGIITGMQFNDRISEVMQRKYIALNLGAIDIENRAKQLMLKEIIEHIPIIDNAGIIVDVISWTDILEEKKHTHTREPHTNQVVIMAGGKGTRLDPFTKILPKPLIPIRDKTVVELIMERFYQCGFSRFTYTLNYKKEYLKLFLRENNFPYEIDWVEEDDFLGTAGGLSLLKGKIDDTFFVANCDSIININFEEVLKWHKDHKASITVIGCHNEIKIPFGVLQLSNSNLEKILEKPVHDVIINTGVYVIEPHVISYVPERQHMDMNHLIDSVAEREKVTAYPIYDGWLDIGQWEEYRKSVEKLGGSENI